MQGLGLVVFSELLGLSGYYLGNWAHRLFFRERRELFIARIILITVATNKLNNLNDPIAQ